MMLDGDFACTGPRRHDGRRICLTQQLPTPRLLNHHRVKLILIFYCVSPPTASGVYTPSGGSASASPAMAKRVVLGLAGCGTLLMALALSSTSGGGAALEGAIVHTGDYCKSNPKYTKDTLKPLLDRPVKTPPSALLPCRP